MYALPRWDDLEALPVLRKFDILLVLIIKEQIALSELRFYFDRAVAEVARVSDVVVCRDRRVM